MSEKIDFFRERFLAIFDNILGGIVLYGLGVLIPVLLGYLLKLEFQIILLLILLVSHLAILIILLSIHNKLRNQNKINKLLVRDVTTKEVNLIDRYGLSHPIKDENTMLYLGGVLGYQLTDIPLSKTRLEPIGAEIVAINKWPRPRTREDNMSWEAQNFLALHKEIRGKPGALVLSFDIRNNNTKQIIQIDSAKLVFSYDAPLASSQISSKNSPTHSGLLTCTLLFSGKSESGRLLPQKEGRLDLLLNRDVTAEEANRILGSRLGYIKFSGIFRETKVLFQIDV